MADVKWIKLSTDTFSDEKVQLLESLPGGDAVLLIWIKLLCLAGRVNDGGYVYVGQNLPYTDEMLATVFHQPVNTVRMAMQTFEQFGMISVDDKGILLNNWGRHQNIEGMERAKALHAARQERYRQKQLAAGDAPASVTEASRDGEVTLLEEDIEKENKKKSKKIQYAPRVKMTEEECSKLVEEVGVEGSARCIDILDTYKGASGKSYKSDYLAIKSWVIDRYREEVRKNGLGPQRSGGSNQPQRYIEPHAEDEYANLHAH